MPVPRTTIAAPAVGQPAPDATLLDPAGIPVRLADRWQAAPRAFALVFVRHYG